MDSESVYLDLYVNNKKKVSENIWIQISVNMFVFLHSYYFLSFILRRKMLRRLKWNQTKKCSWFFFWYNIWRFTFGSNWVDTRNTASCADSCLITQIYRLVHNCRLRSKFKEFHSNSHPISEDKCDNESHIYL